MGAVSGSGCSEPGCSKRPRREVLGIGKLCGEHAKHWEKAGSFAPEVIADSSGKWCGNALRFATREEAERNVRNLQMRWMSVRETRVVRSRDPVNYCWVNGGLVRMTCSACGHDPHDWSKPCPAGDCEKCNQGAVDAFQAKGG